MVPAFFVNYMSRLLFKTIYAPKNEKFALKVRKK